MPKPKAYTVYLDPEEREFLKKCLKKVSSENHRKRIQTILNADMNHNKKDLSYKEIAHKAGVSEPTAITALKAFCNGGIEALLETHRNPASDRCNLKIDGEIEAKLIAKACTPPPEGHKRWTLDLLRDEMMIILQNEEYDFDSVSRASIGKTLQRNDLRPHLSEYWMIPPEQDAEFVACMEDILDVYKRPYNAQYPLWCMDEKPFQILDDVRQPLPMRQGDVAKIDAEYKRNGTVAIFCFIQPHTGEIRPFVEETRTAVDWAEKIKLLVDEIEPDAERIVLVMDNLNTHSIASLYKTFPPSEARRIARKLEVHYTPKHGSWLDIAEIGINIMTRQCLGRRFGDIEKLRHELSAWENDHDKDHRPIDWQFNLDTCRIKLKHLYPDIEKYHKERDLRREKKRENQPEEATIDDSSKAEERTQM